MSPVLSTFSGASARAFGFGYNFAKSDFEHIETQTVGAGGAASVTFSSIPGTYKHLEIRVLSRDSRSVGNVDDLWLRFNGDTAANYSGHALFGDGSTASSASGTSTTSAWAGWTQSNNAAASTFAASVIRVLDYAVTTKYKTTLALSGGDNNGGGTVGLQSGSWRNTNAVSSVTLLPATVNFREFSSFSLYGIK